MKKFLYTVIVLVFGAVAILLLASTGKRTITATVIQNSHTTIYKDECGYLWETNGDDLPINTKVVLTLRDKYTDFVEDDEIIKVEVLK